MTQTNFQKVGTRLKWHYPQKKSAEVQVGRNGDIVFSVHFRNAGLHSIMRVGVNNVRYDLRPGEEKEFAVSPPYSLEETFEVLYEFENQSDYLANGSQRLTDEQCEALMVKKGIIAELYLKGVKDTI